MEKIFRRVTRETLRHKGGAYCAPPLWFLMWVKDVAVEYKT